MLRSRGLDKFKVDHTLTKGSSSSKLYFKLGLKTREKNHECVFSQNN